MAHERHADFLQDSGLHQAGIKGVAEIVKADVADTGVFKPGFPGALHDADRAALKADDQAFRLSIFEQQLFKPTGQGNLTRFSFRGFRMGNEKQLAREIDVFPPLAGDFATPHPGVERGHNHDPQVILGNAEKQLLLSDAQDLAPCAPFAGHFHPGEWIGSQKLFIHGPIENVPKHAQIPVDGGILDGLASVPPAAEFLG
jgi:hypothetical protein